MDATIQIKIVRADPVDREFGINEGEIYHAKREDDYWVVTTDIVRNYYLTADQAKSCG